METTLTLTRFALSPMIDAALAASPRSKERPVKGAELLLAGQVQRTGVDRWLVYGTGGAPYNVSIHAGTCDCPDQGAPLSPLGQKLCKHMYACMFALRAGMPAPLAGLSDEDAALWSPDPEPEPAVDPLDKEIADKLAEMTAAGLDADADLMVIGDWVWVVGDVDPDLADALGCRWHARRNCHYWRPVWAAVEAFNEHADLAGLADKYGVRRHIPRRGSSSRVEKTAQELAMLLVKPVNRDDDGEIWA